ncbi:hypothetical protein PVL29_011444 [Vitis rotundifolia]|uniref:non-specific serine/threonine protein kinase n=1 Tax=Vitis rotundifolia TaxID=103349 RepID=A0AA38ZNJ8_VITRO|nr:hypothetical protein PVL29_011444 [Vitis rotundifolia]
MDGGRFCGKVLITLPTRYFLRQSAGALHLATSVLRRGYAPNGFTFDDDMSISDCQAKCWSECSCVAYASTNDDRTGCEIWSKEMQQLLRVEVYGEAREIYFLPSNPEKKYNRQQELLFELGAITKSLTKYGNANKLEKNGKSSNELQLFSFQSIATATNNFSTENKLGEGGFGPVYKGILLDKQEIAIKKLSRSSGQGLEEFKNEIVLIGKLQHNNLVRLLGCCIKGEEKILIYEYLPNKSLDFFLFGWYLTIRTQNFSCIIYLFWSLLIILAPLIYRKFCYDACRSYKKNLLDWKKRYNIIEGIAQGLLYLHKYSRLKVVHRDLKASNILLDNEMNPKISDFGMARIFGQNESQANTKRIVGTYGYMSPEYAMEGIFSMKSDVFSFGVILLEIVSGRKNYSNYYYKRPLNLIGYAWELWKEGRILELMDQTLGDLCPKNVIRRCIHVGLLCVQENPIDRPTMSEVLSMLSNESMQLSTPKQPAFFIGRTVQESKIPTSRSENCSLNNVSISVLEAR